MILTTEKTYTVRFGTSAITLAKTYRDFQFEKFSACLEIIRSSSDKNEVAIARSLARELKTWLERK